MDGILLLDHLVTIPITNPFPHGIRPIEELHKSNVPFEQASGENAVLRKPSLVGILRIVRPVECQRLVGLIGKVVERCSSQLHLGSEFITRDPRRESFILRIAIDLELIQPSQELAGRNILFSRDLRRRYQIRDRPV